MRRLKRILCFTGAILFLIESWLWDTLYHGTASMLGWVRLDKCKVTIARWIDPLPASICVFIFIIPVLFILPLKLLGVWLITTHHVVFGITIFLFAKLVGLGIAAFLFETCKVKLLTLKWFVTIYTRLLLVKAWSYRQIEPFKRQAQALKKKLAWKKSHMLALLKRLRRQIMMNTKKK